MSSQWEDSLVQDAGKWNRTLQASEVIKTVESVIGNMYVTGWPYGDKSLNMVHVTKNVHNAIQNIGKGWKLANGCTGVGEELVTFRNDDYPFLVNITKRRAAIGKEEDVVAKVAKFDSFFDVWVDNRM